MTVYGLYYRRLQCTLGLSCLWAVHQAYKSVMGVYGLYYYRVQGTMGLSCLWAVHQAYKDREKAEKQASKMEHALSMKEQREAAKERIKVRPNNYSQFKNLVLALIMIYLENASRSIY